MEGVVLVGAGGSLLLTPGRRVGVDLLRGSAADCVAQSQTGVYLGVSHPRARDVVGGDSRENGNINNGGARIWLRRTQFAQVAVEPENLRKHCSESSSDGTCGSWRHLLDRHFLLC
jgi:hypothetical protein